jgi:hypothetical protein
MIYDLTSNGFPKNNSYIFRSNLNECSFINVLDELIATDFFSMVEESLHMEIKYAIIERKSFFIEETNRVFYLDPENIFENDCLLEIQEAFKLPMFHAIKNAVIETKWLSDSYNNTIYCIKINNDMYKLWTFEEFCNADWYFTFGRIINLLEVILMVNSNTKDNIIFEYTDDSLCVILSKRQVEILVNSGFLQSCTNVHEI